MNTVMKRWWIFGLCLISFSISLGGTRSVWAFHFDITDSDPLNWFDECNFGKLFGLPEDGVSQDGVKWIGTTVGGGDCDIDQLRMVDFQIDPINPRWVPGSTLTDGKLIVDIRRRYGFDTNGNNMADNWTGHGTYWRYKSKTTGTYFKGRQSVGSRIKSAALYMQNTESAIPNTGSQIPPSLTTATVSTPQGYYNLYDVRFSGNLTGNSPYSTVGSNGARTWYAGRNVTSRSVLLNANSKTKTITFVAGQVWAKSTPGNNKRYQHIVYAP